MKCGLSVNSLEKIKIYKKIHPMLLIPALLLILPSLSLAQVVNLAWSAPTTNADGSALGDLSYYRVKRSTVRGNYSNATLTSVSAGTTRTTVSGLAAGTYFFVVSAVDFSGNESSHSNEISQTVSGSATPTPTPTFTATPLPTSTSTPRPSATATPTSTPRVIFTSTPAPTSTTTPVATSVPSRTPTPVPSATPVVTIAPTATATPIPTPTGGIGTGSLDNPPSLDFDGDGISDVALEKYSKKSKSVDLAIFMSKTGDLDSFEEPGVRSVASDYDGDGIADVSTISYDRKSRILWDMTLSRDSDATRVVLGRRGDKVLTGCHFSPDGGASLAVYRSRQLTHQIVGKKAITVKLAVSAAASLMGCGNFPGSSVDSLIFATTKRGKGVEIRVISLAGKELFKGLLASNVKLALAADVNGDGSDELVVLKRQKDGTSLVEGIQISSAEVILKEELEKVVAITRARLVDDNGRPADALIYTTVENKAGLIHSLVLRGSDEVAERELPKGYSLVVDQRAR